jgi:AcrR family transcriptional regulator
VGPEGSCAGSRCKNKAHFNRNPYMNERISTKEKILDASIDLFSQKGFYETSIREIAGATGIKTSSLYNHFPSKEAILDAIFEYYKTEISKTKTPDEPVQEWSYDRMRVKFKESFGVRRQILAEPRMEAITRILWIEMLRNPKARRFYREWYFDENRDSCTKRIRSIQKKGLLSTHDPETVSALLNAAMNYYFQQLCLLRADNGDTAELEEHRKKYFDLLLNLLHMGDNKPAHEQ